MSTTTRKLGFELVGAPHPSVALVGLRIALLLVAYYLATLLGYAFLLPSSPISVIWLPNTVLLAALLVSSPRHWAWILLLVLPVHELAHGQQGVTLAQAGLYFVYDCGLVVLTAAAMRRFGLVRLTLRNLRQTLTFIAVVASTTAIATLAWSQLLALYFGVNPWRTAYLVSLANVLPFLIVTPGLIALASEGARIVREASRKSLVELGALIAGLLACGIVIFGFNLLPAGSLFALLYLPLPFLLWAAVRFGPPGLSLSFFGFALIAVINSVAGRGPFTMQSETEGTLSIQAFLLALYVPLLVLATVVQERRDKEKALQDSEARYRAVVEDQTELICRFLPDGTYTFVNGAYCRYFGVSPPELLGRTFWSFIPKEGHQAARDFLASITATHPIATREHEVVKAGGEPRWHQWTDRGFFDSNGRLVEYQAVGRDITERKHLEDAMRGLAHVERLAVVGELTGSIAHEISQPLTAILANAEAADRELGSQSPSLDELRAILSDIRLDDLRASEVIQRMRAMLRKREPVMSTFRVGELVAEVIALVRAEARRRRVTLETVLDSGADVFGDRVQLQQVLLNLIVNGMEAMGDTPLERRRLLVRSDTNGSQNVRVTVSDRGVGIPADRLFRVFDSFYSTKDHGMGLGLAIARSIVEIHGGHIWAENDPAGGATFFFTLPLAVTPRETVH